MHGYFEQGHSPSSALYSHHLNLAIQYDGRDSDLDCILADRSSNPMYSDVYYLYKKWRKKQHGEPNGERMFDQLAEAVQQYNKEEEKHTLKGLKDTWIQNLSVGKIDLRHTPGISHLYTTNGTCSQISQTSW